MHSTNVATTCQTVNRQSDQAPCPVVEPEIDLDKLDNWVAVVNEEHDLNREGQCEGVVQWLGGTCPDIALQRHQNLVPDNNCSLASSGFCGYITEDSFFYLSCWSAEVTRIPNGHERD